MLEVKHSVSSMHDLSVDLLAEVLRHTAQRDRLCYCAFVCKKWYRTSKMATVRVEYTADYEQGDDSFALFQAWLLSFPYAHSITDLSLAERAVLKPPGDLSYVKPVIQLPFSELKELTALKVPNCYLRAAYSAAEPSTATAAIETVAALTALSRLELSGTALDMSELGSCTGLQHVQLKYVSHEAAEIPAPSEAETAAESEEDSEEEYHLQLATALTQLTQLTHLTLNSAFWGTIEGNRSIPSLNACLSNMQQLQEFRFSLPIDDLLDLAQLPASLTLLEFDAPPALTVSTTPCLTQLQQLYIMRGFQLNPTVIGSLTSLTRVCIKDTELTEIQPAEQLMTALAQLTQLKELELDECFVTELPIQPRYTALTASSYLTSIKLTENHWGPQSDQFIFPSNKPPTQLRVAEFGSHTFSWEGSFGLMAACCPELQELTIVSDYWSRRKVLGDCEGLSALASLTALTKFAILKKVSVDDAHLQKMAACTQLREFKLEAFDNLEDLQDQITSVGLLQLTQLTALTHVELSGTSVANITLHNKAPAGSPPDVYQQLESTILSLLHPS